MMDFGFPFDDEIKDEDILLDSIPFQLEEERISLKRNSNEMSHVEQDPADNISMPVFPYRLFILFVVSRKSAWSAN